MTYTVIAFGHYDAEAQTMAEALEVAEAMAASNDSNAVVYNRGIVEADVFYSPDFGRVVVTRAIRRTLKGLVNPLLVSYYQGLVEAVSPNAETAAQELAAYQILTSRGVDVELGPHWA